MNHNLVFFLASTPTFPNARCTDAGVDPEIFFPNSIEDLERDLPMVRKICQSCEHQTECMAFAVDNYEQHGIWGGTTPADRQRIWDSRESKKQRRISHSMELGERASELRNQDWSWEAIAERLAITPTYAERLVYRWRKRNGAA